MSALTTHTSNQFREKRKRKEMKEKLKQVIKCQIKDKKRSLERERSRAPKARATARHNRDKMLQTCRLLKVRFWLDTIGKRAQLKSRQKRAPKSMNASSP
jgi:hypothetical protein